MKPNANEFTGVVPFRSPIEGMAGSMQASMDLLDSAKEFYLGDLQPDETITLETADGEFTFRLIARPRQPDFSTRSAQIIEILSSTLADFTEGEEVRIDGSGHGSLVQAGSICLFTPIAYSKFPHKPLPEADVAYLQGLSDEERSKVLDDLKYITFEDGVYYTERWDSVWRRTASEVLRATKTTPEGENIPIFK